VHRIGLVVHPTRPIDKPLATLRDWSERHDVELVQLRTGSDGREVAPFGEVDSCDLVAAVGGDGTVLAAMRAAAEASAPVLGIACGSVEALAAVTAEQLADALDKFASGSWLHRSVPSLEVEVDGHVAAWALNDFVVVRRQGQQVRVDVQVGDELYARMSGDGVIVATPLGSSAYTMAAHGPLVVAGTESFVVTPLPAHGGTIPPLVVPSSCEVSLQIYPGFGGFDVEIDGRTTDLHDKAFTLRLVEARATLVGLGDPGLGLTPLRRRGLITDSPHVLAHEARVKARAQRERG